MRDFNELEHEFELRRNRAYKHSVKYMDLFPNPLLTMFAKNLAFIAGSLFAVLVVLTIIQEDLLTAHNILKILTILGTLHMYVVHVSISNATLLAWLTCMAYLHGLLAWLTSSPKGSQYSFCTICLV